MEQCLFVLVNVLLLFVPAVRQCSVRDQANDLYAMASSRDNELTSDSYKKLARFYATVYDRSYRQCTRNLLDEPGDINYQFPASAYLKSSKPDVIGSTALHLLESVKKKDVFVDTLKAGAVFTVKNEKGLTVLLQSVHRRIYDDFKDNWSQGWFQAQLPIDFSMEFAQIILSAHVEFKNPINPRDKNGISHMHIACMMDHSESVEFFLNNGVPVDHSINEDSPILAGYTPLHIAAQCGCLKTVNVLLKFKAGATVRGSTALHTVVKRNMEIVDWMHTKETTIHCFSELKSQIEAKEKVIDLFIGNTDGGTNVVDDIGFSYLHAAATLRNTSMVEKLLETGVDPNHSVRMDSPLWPGYTPLHFAAHFNAEMVKLLISKGADIEARDAYGATPFDMCVERFTVEDLHFILSSHAAWKDIKLSDGVTNLVDLVNIMKDTDKMSNLDMNVFVPIDSPLWPGYTILHLATIFTETIKNVNDTSTDDESSANDWSMDSDCDERLAKRPRYISTSSYLQRIQTCLQNGADLTAKDVHGTTPLHLAFRLQQQDAVKLMFDFHPDTENPIDKDNLSHLYIASYSKKAALVEKLLSTNDTNVNIPLLPTFQWNKNPNSSIQKYRSSGFKSAGSTPLHAAVTVGAENTAMLLLKHGADINAKDANELTPFHMIFSRHYNLKMAEILMAQPDLKDSVFNGGLSHLHLATFFSNADAIEKLLDDGANINQIMTTNSNSPFKDYDKWSPQPLAFMKEYEGCTPLHIAVGLFHADMFHTSLRNSNIAELLLRRGADMFIKNAHGRSVAYMTLHRRYLSKYGDPEIAALEKDINLQRRMVEDSGITMLHIACWKLDVEAVESLLSQGADVNAQAHPDAPVWPGWTPMHVLMIMSSNNKLNSKKVDAILQLLLDNGADLTLANVELDTPLHLTEPGKLQVEVISSVTYRTYANSPYTGLVLDKLKDKNVNPSNNAGISHFHIASLRNDVKHVQTFLENGVDVNAPIDFMSDRYPGCTALHLALKSGSNIDTTSRVATVDLLLKHGANVHAQDTYGNTPLHFAVECQPPRQALLEKLANATGDLKVENLFGLSPFETLLKSGSATIEDIQFFLQRGYSINSFSQGTGQGYIAQIFAARDEQSFSMEDPLVKEVFNLSGLLKVDEMGRNAIHNVVSIKNAGICDYSGLIEQLMNKGCGINSQDNQGRTPLHTAVKFLNYEAVRELLKLGADMNIVDTEGKTAFARSFDYWNKFITFSGANFGSKLIKSLAVYVQKMKMCGLHVHKLNHDTLVSLPRYAKAEEDDIIKFQNEIEKTKTVEIDPLKITLFDFLSDTGPVVEYSTMTDVKRSAIDEFFKPDNIIRLSDEFPEFVCLLRMQYQRARSNKKD